MNSIIQYEYACSLFSQEDASRLELNLLHECRLLECHSPENARAVFLWL